MFFPISVLSGQAEEGKVVLLLSLIHIYIICIAPISSNPIYIVYPLLSISSRPFSPCAICVFDEIFLAFRQNIWHFALYDSFTRKDVQIFTHLPKPISPKLYNGHALLAFAVYTAAHAFDPVSYTHLAAVYPILSLGNTLKALACLTHFFQRKRHCFLCAFQGILTILIGHATQFPRLNFRISLHLFCLTAVSYTHLDVYKRQLHLHAAAALK